jgi:hypothetical protein
MFRNGHRDSFAGEKSFMYQQPIRGLKAGWDISRKIVASGGVSTSRICKVKVSLTDRIPYMLTA